MKFSWRAIAIWALATIPTAAGVGWSANRLWQSQFVDRLTTLEGQVTSLKGELNAVSNDAKLANQRLSCLTLMASDPLPGPSYGAAAVEVNGSRAGVTDWYPAPPHAPSVKPNTFMVGQKDGTGASTNIAEVVNYYRAIWIETALTADGKCASSPK